MTTLEFDILDELYFVTPFARLLDEVEVDEVELKGGLQTLLDKKWVRCMSTVDDEVEEDVLDFENHYKDYHYLATKKGLMAHNRS